MMSKKDYQLIATTLGRSARNANTLPERVAIFAAADELGREMRSTNSRFSTDLFSDWVREVANEVRDEWTGNRVITNLTFPAI